MAGWSHALRREARCPLEPPICLAVPPPSPRGTDGSSHSRPIAGCCWLPHRGDDVAHIEIFTPTGVVSGSSARSSVDTDSRGTAVSMPVEASRWYPLDGTSPQRRGNVTVAPDEILVVILAAPPFTIHASWYPIELDVGPYRVDARLPVAPGFDPARALARPTGAFVALRDVSISLIGRSDGGIAERPHAHINRYAVDRIASTLMLAFFFPGATHDRVDDQSALPQVMAARPSPA
jgi:hypothetical protein